MRTDVRINGRQTKYLKNASTFGGCKYKDQKGDIIFWRIPFEDGTQSDPCFGRVMGQIEHCYTNTGEYNPVGKLVVMRMGDTLTQVYENWVDPDWIYECRPADQFHWGGFLTNFFSPEFMKENLDDLRSNGRQARWNYAKP